MLYDKRWDKQLEVELSPGGKALLEAADYIEARGWKQAFGDWGGPVCPITALDNLGYLGHTPAGMGARKLFFKCHGDHLLNWNDAVGRTKEQVVAGLRAAAHFVEEV